MKRKIDFTSIFGRKATQSSSAKSKLSILFDKDILTPSSSPSNLKTIINGLDRLMKLEMEKSYFDASEDNSRLFALMNEGIQMYAQSIPDYMKQDIIDELGQDPWNDDDSNVSPLFAKFVSGTTAVSRFDKLGGYVGSSAELIDKDPIARPIVIGATGSKDDGGISVEQNSLAPDKYLYPAYADYLRNFCDFIGTSTDNLVFNDIIYINSAVSTEFLNLGNSKMEVDPKKDYFTDFYTGIVVASSDIQEFSLFLPVFEADKTGKIYIDEELNLGYIFVSVPHYIIFMILARAWVETHSGSLPPIQEIYNQTKEVITHCSLTPMEMSWDDTKMNVINLRSEYDKRKAAYTEAPLPTGFGDITYPYMLPILIWPNTSASVNESFGVCLPLDTFIDFEKSIYDWDVEKEWFDPDYCFTYLLEEQIEYHNINPTTTFVFIPASEFIKLNPELPLSNVSACIIDTVNSDTKMNLNVLTENDENVDPHDYIKTETITTYPVMMRTSDIELTSNTRYISDVSLLDIVITPADINPILEGIELPDILDILERLSH